MSSQHTTSCIVCGIQFTYLRLGNKPRTYCDSCKTEKRRQYLKDWYEANREEERKKRKAKYEADKERILAKNRAYYHVNKDKLDVKRREWYKRNKEQTLARGRAWYQANKERVREVTRAWKLSNWERYQENNSRRYVATKNGEGRLTAEQWKAIKAAYGNRCCYCGRKMKRLTQDHVIPLSKGGTHTPDNVVPACLSCNAGKRDRQPPTLPPVRLMF